MAGTVVGQAIDYLVAQLQAPAAAAVPDALIVDGNTNDELAKAMVWIGRTGPMDRTAATSTREYPVLGTRRVDETWQIRCFVDVRRDGTSQKGSRDDALALWDVVCHLHATDPTLGGLLTNAWWAMLTGGTLQQPDPETTAETRTVIPWVTTIKNRYSA